MRFLPVSCAELRAAVVTPLRHAAPCGQSGSDANWVAQHPGSDFVVIPTGTDADLDAVRVVSSSEVIEPVVGSCIARKKR